MAHKRTSTLLDTGDEAEDLPSRKTLCSILDLISPDYNFAVIHGTSILIYRRHKPWSRYMLLSGASEGIKFPCTRASYTTVQVHRTRKRYMAALRESMLTVLTRVLFASSQVHPEVTEVNFYIHYSSINCNKMKTIKRYRLSRHKASNYSHRCTSAIASCCAMPLPGIWNLFISLWVLPCSPYDIQTLKHTPPSNKAHEPRPPVDQEYGRTQSPYQSITHAHSIHHTCQKPSPPSIGTTTPILSASKTPITALIQPLGRKCCEHLAQSRWDGPACFGVRC
jgi:hypothetical protein